MSKDRTATIHQFPGAKAPAAAAIRDAIAKTVTRIAPLWPLDQFVAVNPFLGFCDETFDQAARRVRLAYDGRLYMEPGFYLQALNRGELLRADIAASIQRDYPEQGLQVDEVIEAVETALQEPTGRGPAGTCAAIAGELSGLDWTETVTERISHWAAGYFDQGQATWLSPFRHLRPYAAWKQEMAIDCSDTVLGLSRSQESLAELPDEAAEACEFVLRKLSISENKLDIYLHRLLASISGWVAFSRFKSWQEELAGEEPDLVIDLLAIRLSWEYVLFRDYAGVGAELAWRRAMNAIPGSLELAAPLDDAERALSLIHGAYEYAWERLAISRLRGSTGNLSEERPDAQLVFCIDVRSEVFRRALEACSHSIETLGFAGFFGLPVEYVPLDGATGVAHCPVLLQPALEVHEQAGSETPEIRNRLTRRVRLRRQLAAGWRAFKNSAVSCFVFVESYGPAYAVKLAAQTLGRGRPEPHPLHRGLSPRVARELGPQLTLVDGAGVGIGIERQIEFAESMLRGMSLTANFARLVVLTGHGSSTTNNAHGTGLDCGACGGQTGETSARIGALILNSPLVREGLAERGLKIPVDTLFLAALHNTTTDAVTIFDEDRLPSSHEEDLKRLQRRLQVAGRSACAERSRLLPAPGGEDPAHGAQRRSRDWSEVRPEWGLAGCAGFVAATRAMTRNLDLEGECFLHSYDYRQDRNFETLELIMTAPMVVASWISLQYYGSAVDNQCFGSGNKTLHNVIGGSLGVLEGNGGDLRVGLPWQSVHNGRELMHSPRRLSVFLAAPITAINEILGRHEHIRQLVDNGWLKLFAIYDGGAVVARYLGDSQWGSTAVADKSANGEAVRDGESA